MAPRPGTKPGMTAMAPLPAAANPPSPAGRTRNGGIPGTMVPVLFSAHGFWVLASQYRQVTAPPWLVMWGSTVALIRAPATTASAALPPDRSTSSIVLVTAGWLLDAAARFPRATGFGPSLGSGSGSCSGSAARPTGGMPAAAAPPATCCRKSRRVVSPTAVLLMSGGVIGPSACDSGSWKPQVVPVVPRGLGRSGPRGPARCGSGRGASPSV